QGLLGYQYPIAAAVDLHATVSGTRLAPHGHASVSLSEIEAFGETFHSLRSDVSIAGNTLEVDHLVLQQTSSGHLTGSGAYELKTHALRFELDGRAIDLSRIHHLQGARAKVEGRGDIHARGLGSTDEPLIDAQLRLSDLVVNGERIGSFDAD